MPPKILFVGAHDWANLCNRISRAINSYVGERVARVYTVGATAIGFQEDLTGAPDKLLDLPGLIENADWIISTGEGNYTVFREIVTARRAKRPVNVGVTHAGTAYRQHPIMYNRIDKDIGAQVRFIGADSLHLAKDDVTACPYFGTCDPLPKPVRAEGRVRVTHSPASRGRRAQKGTDVILPVMEQLCAGGVIDIDLIEDVSPHDALARRALSHIHVDQMNSDVGGFGQSAVEAMGAGLAVLANTRFVTSKMEQYIPRPPVIDVRDARELRDWLEFLARERDVLHRYRCAAWEWAQLHATPEAVARYWLERLTARCSY